MTVTGFDGYLDPLDEAECRRLLAAQSVARIGFVHEGRVLVLPVGIVTDGEVVVFTTSPRSALAGLAQGADVALQLDDYDPGFLDGWSVLVEGRTFPYEGSSRPERWARGHDAVAIGVLPTRISGRTIAAPLTLEDM